MSDQTLLAVFAHPEDESFSCGGVLYRHSRDGTRTVMVCATNGDVGAG